MQDIFLYVVLAAMLVMMFLNSRKRKKAAEDLQNQVVTGAKVILMSGIVGTIVSAENDRIVLKTAGSNIEVLRAAVRTVSNDVAAPAVELAKPAATAKAAAKPAAKATPKAVAKPATKATTKTAKPAAKKN